MRVARQRWSAWLACGWAIAFGAVHLYWALGGSVGLNVSAGSRLAHERPIWFVLIGLWGVAFLCLSGGAVAWTLARPSFARVPRAVAIWGCRAVGALMLVRGVGIELLIWTGASLSVSQAERFWTLVLWNPWFILGGMFFLGASADRDDFAALSG